jgi:hypothetical protein
MRHSLYLLDTNGNPQNVINGFPVMGELGGWHNLQYVPSGAFIDQVPQNTFVISMNDYRNAAVQQGAKVMVWDNDVGAEVTRGPILTTSDSVDANEIHWSTVTFADDLYDLVRADVTSSFASDIGYTNTGPSDPVPSRVAETLTQVGQRLLSLADTPWIFKNDVTGLDGILFSATGSIVQALDKLRQERFAHFTREMFGTNPRLVHFSDFGQPFTFNGAPVWLMGTNSNPTSGAANFGIRQMFTPQFNNTQEVINSITPTGAGNGTSQLRLRILYGAGGFIGFNPLYPILQRPTQSGATSDGFDYYIEDAASVAKYGRTRRTLPVPDVGVTVAPDGTTTPVSETAAAISLYTVAVNSLIRTAHPTTELSFTTAGVGDVRNIGGRTVHVKYDGWSYDPKSGAPAQFLSIDADYYVLSVTRAEDDNGNCIDTWVVSSSGQAIASAGGVLLGAVNTLTALHAAVQTMPSRQNKFKSQNIGPGNGGNAADLVLNIHADNSIVRTQWAILWLTLSGMVHTRADTGHTQDVTTAPMNTDVNAIGHDVNALSMQFEIGGVVVSSPLVYDPSTKLHLASGTAPGGAVPLMTDGTFVWAAGHPAHDIALSAQLLGIVDTARTTDTSGNPVNGTGGKVKATTGAADIAAGDPTPGTVGGSVPKNTHAASSGYGAALKVATTEEVYLGPAPTGVTVWIDGVLRFGPYSTTPGPISILPYVSDQAAHEIRVKSPTNGMADVEIDLSRDVAPIAVTPQ